MTGTRIISAVFIAGLLIAAVLVLPPAWSALALSLVLLAAGWEWSAFVAQRAAPRLAFMLVLAMLCMLWWQLSSTRTGLRAVLWAALSYWVFMTGWVVANRRATRTLIAVSGLFAVSFAWLALVRMRIDWQHGQLAVMYALLIVWLADSGAYFAGRRWGGARLAPAISPGKTWAGMWGGVAVCVVLALAVSLWRGLPWVALLAVTLAVTAFSVIGDLNESLAKRYAGVKDSGNLIPGHGGLLDRFDSLLAAAPVLMLGIELVPELRG